ncbi:hypothetical protein POJ06DRAFT_271343 [Lipomyces tetrasporus]|uniref:Uncharacterized protein n=1 Tax=Lipomyces tetrasporus TaxID=54092 RepID=A0AAD7QN95_9ASCO|nr:uncharacterized protein POJ06DRAFT_271343 [Lipomyces tetrasporus]KAJ8096977.1 hypothetical protein POJ06DRAFT_271343 [Lipomyces tetrasporus]
MNGDIEIGAVEWRGHTDTQPAAAAPVHALHEGLYHKQLTMNAKLGAEVEQRLHPLRAIRVYRKAIFWCDMGSMCVVMEGYDTILIANFYALQPNLR